MNNYYVLIYLNRILNGNIIGSTFTFAISPHKDVLECYLMKDDIKKRIIFSVNSRETALFIDNFRPPKKNNVVAFFEPLEGQKITDVSLAEHDRLLSIYFGEDTHLLFKLFGHDANAFVVKNGLIKDAFKHPESITNTPPPQPQVPNFATDITAKAKPKNQLTTLNPLLPRSLLPALIKQHGVDEMSIEQVKEFTRHITEALENDPHPRVLASGEVCLWSQKWLDMPTEKSFENVNDAIRFAYRNAVHLRRLHSKKERLAQFLERALSKSEAQYQQLQQADKSLERADEYEKFGHLLMSNAHRSVNDGISAINVTDFYENNKSISIPIKAGKSIAQNAERFYEKAKSSRTSYQKAKQRIPKIKRQKEQIALLFEELKKIDRLYRLDEWIKKNAEDLENLGYGTEDEGQAQSPFRKFRIGKYEVWIGKNAKSNDALTSHAHKEDIWLHARGVGGSHAVIRMGNEKTYPPKKVILHAASYAAWYSKAKGMKTAPVIYTKRKYVYKPSGAAPGAVVVKREEVAMVPPTKPK